MSRSLQAKYKQILELFLKEKKYKDLLQKEPFCELLEQKITPDQLVNLHYMTLKELYPDLPEHISLSFELLLEVMEGYGLTFQEQQNLIDRQKELESQIEVAAKMQKTLLPKQIPSHPQVDIGVLTVPAGMMSGDYYYCVTDANNRIGIAIADIIGKGVPAALCMSMIKYALDSIPEQRMQPAELLEKLNRVVERNIGDSMFITMMCGLYEPDTDIFYYSGAGHEPGFYYEAKTDAFVDLYAKGVVLGLMKKSTYREYSLKLSVGDMIIFLSDGVTECRRGDHFIDRDEIIRLLRKYIHLPAQEIVKKVYRELAIIQNFSLKDDFTLMILRRKVS